MKKPWYYRMLLSYLPIFFLITSFLFFIFFQELSSQLKRDAVKANQVLNLMAMDKVVSALESVDYAITNFSLNNKILSEFFRETNKQNLYLNMEMLKEITVLKQQNPLIDSIYLVRNHDDIVLTEKYMFSISEFSDYSYIKEVEETKGWVKWTSPRNYKEFDRLPAKKVITLARSFYTPLGEQCLIVALVKTDSIGLLVEQNYNPEISFVTIEGNNGNPIFDNMSDSADREILAIKKSSYLDWTFRSGLVNGAFAKLAFEVSRFWVMLGVITVILGLIAIVYVTRRNYRPLENVVSHIQSHFNNKSDHVRTGTNEFKLIESAIEDLMKRTTITEKRQEEEITLRKKHFLYEVIEGIRHVTEEEWLSEMGKYNLPCRLHGVQVLAIEIDNYSDFSRNFTRHDQFLFKYAIHNSATEIFRNYSLYSWSEWLSGNRLICIVHQSEHADTNRNRQACDEFISWVTTHLPLTITVGMGAMVDRHDQIRESYQEALYTLKYKFFKGLGMVISLAEMNVKQGAELFSYLQPIRSLAHDFRIGMIGWSETFNQLFTNFRSDFLLVDDVINLLDYLIFQLDRTIGELAPEYQKPWKEKGISSLTDVLETTETLHDIQLRFFSILYEIGEMIGDAHEANNHHQLLLEVRGYIEAHFTDPEMSLDRLKEQFDLNPKYLSQLFKDKFGEGFMDFLIRLRIERAKQLLQTTSDPIQTISGRVGYLNVISFTRIFKKITSMSPGDFRKQMGQ
jgi:two-component system response regulator YesN